MLRRGQCTSKATFGAVSSLCARRHVSAEEQAEIDREAKLRQDFMKKKMFLGKILPCSTEPTRKVVSSKNN